MRPTIPSYPSDDRVDAARLLGIVHAHAAATAEARHVDDLAAPLSNAATAIGFNYVAFAEHGGLSGARPRLLLTNYPPGWRSAFIAQALHRIDPVQQACRARSAGFRWSELAELIRIEPRQRALLEHARRQGLGEGYTVPLHVPGVRLASCSFAVPRKAVFPHGASWAAELIARDSFDRALTLRRHRGAPRLSPRQQACIALLATGLTDRGIARRLALSEETVTKYLNAARARYELATRTQLVAAALRDGVIGFEDLALD